MNTGQMTGPMRYEERIAALEKWKECRFDEIEERISALEWRIRENEWDAVNERISALEDIVVKLGARHELLVVKHHERIAILEEIAALEERIHEVKEERSR